MCKVQSVVCEPTDGRRWGSELLEFRSIPTLAGGMSWTALAEVRPACRLGTNLLRTTGFGTRTLLQGVRA